MHRFATAFVGLVIGSAAATVAAQPAEPPLPLGAGIYRFQHRFAEQPDMGSITVSARVRGHHITVINHQASSVFPKGVIAEGTLMWNASAMQWIIGTEPADRDTTEVGGCSAGPEVVDLVRRIYWTC